MLASRLGYRITAKFVHTFFGRVFDNPTTVFTEDMLKPEMQDPAVFADGVANIVEAQRRVAAAYFEDGTIEDACPPLQALLHIMAHGQFEGKDASDPGDPRAVHPGSPARERLVPGAAGDQAEARRRALGAAHAEPEGVPRAAPATATRPGGSASGPGSSTRGRSWIG